MKLRGSQYAEHDFPNMPIFRRGHHETESPIMTSTRSALITGPDLGPSVVQILAAGMCLEAAMYTAVGINQDH